jgi:hypothetical protein
LSQSETNLAAAAVAEGAINIEIRHNNNQASVNSNVNNSNNVENLSRSSGDLIGGRLGGGVLKNGGSGGSVSVVNLPAVVNNNSSNSSAEELYHGYNNNNNNGGESSNPLFPRFGAGGGSNNSRYNNFLYPADRNARGFFPHQATTAAHNSTSNLTGFGRAGGGQLHHLLSQERLFHNRSRSVENLFDQQGTLLLRHAATASDISLQPRPSAGSYYGEPLVAGPLRSAASAVAVGGGRVHQYQQQQQRMKATQSEQLLTKIGKLEKVNRSYSTVLYNAVLQI